MNKAILVAQFLRELVRAAHANPDPPVVSVPRQASAREAAPARG